MEAAVLRILRSLKEDTHGHWQHANNYRLNDGSRRSRRRNELAEQAGRDHRDRAQRLYDAYDGSRNVRDVLAELRSCCDHANHWASKFRNWGGHDNGYAEYIHHEAAKLYSGAVASLEGINLAPDVNGIPATTEYVRIFGCNGQQDGEMQRSLEITEGYEAGVELSGELSAKVWAKAQAAGDVLTAKVEASGGFEIAGHIRGANSYKHHRAMKTTINIKINFSKPTYWYQLRTTVPMDNTSPIMLFGGWFMSHYPLETPRGAAGQVAAAAAMLAASPSGVRAPQQVTHGHGGGNGERVFTLAAGDNPYAICEREFGDGMLYLQMEYNGRRLTEQSARNLPDGARLVYRGGAAAGGGGGARGGGAPAASSRTVVRAPAAALVAGGGGRGRVFTLAAGDNPYAICEREFGDGMLYLHMEYNGRRLTEQSARNLPDGAHLVYPG
ncbi:hypothetical protein HXX76_012866 [Chlamydomonas incerta]|uniref:Uncharacterized protein n=1 Tax=Chlamydomonas incerta TaxID=51695 RepID=A0A835SNI7_CHLIN|nr:hypothetical protein HXX76_012866 [Chlamydomonas incerta]|eukprot:KAG2426813.1 hypothetical protein HXX76_012866 [Chlamydomonas incerta]